MCTLCENKEHLPSQYLNSRELTFRHQARAAGIKSWFSALRPIDTVYIYIRTVSYIWQKQKYYVTFVYILQGKMGKTEKTQKENHATKVTKIPNPPVPSLHCVRLLQKLEKERKKKIQPIKHFAPLHFGTFPRSCVYIANKNWANLCSDFRPYLSFARTPFLSRHSSVVNFTHFPIQFLLIFQESNKINKATWW